MDGEKRRKEKKRTAEGVISNDFVVREGGEGMSEPYCSQPSQSDSRATDKGSGLAGEGRGTAFLCLEAAGCRKVSRAKIEWVPESIYLCYDSNPSLFVFHLCQRSRGSIYIPTGTHWHSLPSH